MDYKSYGYVYLLELFLSVFRLAYDDDDWTESALLISCANSRLTF